MRYYAVIDTNVLVSAMLKWDSIPGSILGFAFSGTVIPVLNAAIFQEYREVLLRPKFHFTPAVVDPVLEAIHRYGIYVDETSLAIALPDPKDQVFFEVVMEKRKSEDAYLVTGNQKHFPVTPFIVTPREFLDIILSDSTESP